MTTLEEQQLSELAKAYGIATEYWDYTGSHRQVSQKTILSILRAMGVEVTNDLEVIAALRQKQEEPWRHLLPPCLVVREDQTSYVWVHIPDGQSVTVTITLEDGEEKTLRQVDHYFPPQQIDGKLIGRATFEVPSALPLGWHTLRAQVLDGESGSCPLAVTPGKLEVAALNQRKWGLMAQLYSVRSHRSWGIGDAVDLRNLCALVSNYDADFCLINPVHAAGPTYPITPSPYLPTTRRFVSPQYIRPEAIAEVGYLDAHKRRVVQALLAAAQKHQGKLLDRSRSWKHKLAALEIIYQVPRGLARENDFRKFCGQEGKDLEDFALWYCLAEIYGNQFPPEYRDINSKALQEKHQELSERAKFWMWTQWIVQDQFKTTQKIARQQGMEIGVMHDLAVGIASYGADRWMHPDWFAEGIEVGAPADMYNQLGQNWSQPPWLPQALAKCAYQPLRDMARTVASLGGAIRLDHVIGLFRLWWIPQDATSPAEGTYVRYDHEAMVGIILLEAQRQGVVIIGEDLGTVEPWVRDYLIERGILGTSVMWFEGGEDGLPLAPNLYRELALATVNTHDLPPTVGFLREAHIDLGERLGLFDIPVADMRASAAADRQRMLQALQREGVVGENPSEQEFVEAMHRYVSRTCSKLVAATLVDAVGEVRMQNQPGTYLEYPNWQIPLGDEDGNPIWLDDLVDYPRLKSLLEVMRSERPRKTPLCGDVK